MRAEVLTQWIGTGVDMDFNRPKIADDYTLTSWADTTGQPTQNLTPDPNMYIVQIECDAATLATIEADPAYFVLWSDA